MDRDSQLVHNIKAALEDQLQADGMDINIEVKKNNVHISGFVDCLSDKIEAMKIVQSFEDVRKIENNITIVMDGSLTDKQIKEKIEAGLRHCVNAHHLKNVSARVEGGAATLIGSVRVLADEVRALEVAREVLGVKHVASNIRIETADTLSDDATLTSRVQQSLNTSTIAHHSIKPRVHAGIVTLSGIVNTNYETELAGELIANVEGIVKIKNQLEKRE